MSEPFFEDYEDFSFDNINSIINYIKNNYIKFLLLLFAFFIIFAVDYISYINTIIFSLPYAMPSSSMIGIQNQSIQNNISNNQHKKRRNFKK